MKLFSCGISCLKNYRLRNTVLRNIRRRKAGFKIPAIPFPKLSGLEIWALQIACALHTWVVLHALGGWSFPGTFGCKLLQEKLFYGWSFCSLFPLEHVCRSINFCLLLVSQLYLVSSTKQWNTQAFSTFLTSAKTCLARHEHNSTCPLWLNGEKPLHASVDFLTVMLCSLTPMGAFFFYKMEISWYCQTITW